MASLRVGMGFEIEVRGRSAEAERLAFESVLEQVVLGDQLGYDTAWFVEHHFTRGFSHSSSPDIVLGALSRMTSRIRLGLGVVLLPFQHPVRTAERVATLDVLSGGRVEFGTGRGASPLEYQAFQRPFEQSRRIWEDNLDAVLQIWAADGEPVTLEHEFWNVPDVAVYPRPVQRPHPPIWTASTSLDGYLAAAAKGHHLLSMTMLKGLDDVAEDIAAYRKCLADHGHDPETRRVALMIPWHTAPTREEAYANAVDAGALVHPPAGQPGHAAGLLRRPARQLPGARPARRRPAARGVRRDAARRTTWSSWTTWRAPARRCNGSRRPAPPT